MEVSDKNLVQRIKQSWATFQNEWGLPEDGI